MSSYSVAVAVIIIIYCHHAIIRPKNLTVIVTNVAHRIIVIIKKNIKRTMIIMDSISSPGPAINITNYRGTGVEGRPLRGGGGGGKV